MNPLHGVVARVRRRPAPPRHHFRRQPADRPQLRAGAERPPEPCYMTVLFGGHPVRR
jgi:hypothetical protein